MNNFIYHLNMLGFNIAMLLCVVMLVLASIALVHFGKLMIKDFKREMEKISEAEKYKEEHKDELQEKSKR